MPIAAIVLSLIISTPVFAEFRYIYVAFCIIPIVGIMVCQPSPHTLATTTRVCYNILNDFAIRYETQ